MNAPAWGPGKGPTKAQSTDRFIDPSSIFNAEWALSGAPPFGPGYPRALGRVAPLAQVRDMGCAPRLAQRPWPPRRGCVHVVNTL